MSVNGFLQSPYRTPPADLADQLQNQWRLSNIGTTTATLTVKCPTNTIGTRAAGLAITTLYATGSGGTLTISDGVTELQYLLTATPLQLLWPKGLTMEKASDLTISIAGAAAGASIGATGIVLR